MTTDTVTVYVDGKAVNVGANETAAAAALQAGLGFTRTSPVTGEQRAPYCMMGVCFDCLVRIDGVGNRQGCLVQVREGMRIEVQRGKREIAP
jgi:predicted molibdopterin-dependent oxidoreductase YjgC